MLPGMTDPQTAATPQASMRAIRVERLGPPDVMQLQDTPVPSPAPGEVRVRVEAVGINFADALAVAGEYLTRKIGRAHV